MCFVRKRVCYRAHSLGFCHRIHFGWFPPDVCNMYYIFQLHPFIIWVAVQYLFLRGNESQGAIFLVYFCTLIKTWLQVWIFNYPNIGWFSPRVCDGVGLNSCLCSRVKTNRPRWLLKIVVMSYTLTFYFWENSLNKSSQVIRFWLFFRSDWYSWHVSRLRGMK